MRERYNFDSEWTGLWLATKIIMTTKYEIKSLKTWKLLYIFKILNKFSPLSQKKFSDQEHFNDQGILQIY